MTETSKDDNNIQASSDNPSSKTIKSAPSSLNSFVSINKLSSNSIAESDISHNDKNKELLGKSKLEKFEHIINRIVYKKT